jgi:hypothetical protein
MDSYERLKAELPKIAKAVNEFTSEQVQQEAFRALLRALAGDAAASPNPAEAPADGEEPKRLQKRGTGAKGAKASAAVARSGGRLKVTVPTLDKTLDLRPKGAKSFVDFADEMKPANGNEKNLVAVYYLERIAGMANVNVNQIYTCYRDVPWRVPNNLRNALAVTASTKAWINTADMDDIKVTPSGENIVVHDLPAKSKT